MGGVFLKKGLKRAGICLLLMLSLRLGGFLAGITEREPDEADSFRSAVKDVGDGKLAGEYLKRIWPKLKTLAELSREEMKNMFPKE